MKALVKGFRGAERADITIDPIALIGGNNFHGKSSVCQAVAAALTMESIPFFRSTRPDKALLTKTDAKGLVRGGMDTGVITLTSGSGRTTVGWPRHEIKSEGEPPVSSKVAAGLISPAEMEDVERQKFLSVLLDAAPSQQHLLLACTDVGLGVDTANETWSQIRQQGWDVAHRLARERGAKIKGRWEAATGTDFGLKKAAGWLPPDFPADLNQTTLAQLEEQCATAKQQVDNAIGALAVDTAELQHIGEQAKQEKELLAAVQKQELEHQRARQEYENCKKTVEVIVVPRIFECPHCSKPLQTGAEGVKKASLSADQVVGLQCRRSAAEKTAGEAGLAMDIAGKELQGLKMKLGAVAGATERWRALGKRSGSQEALDIARDLYASLEQRRSAMTAKSHADLAYREIVEQLKIVEILAPDGLRRQKLAQALTRFNGEYLDPLCRAAGYPLVALNDDLDIVYGGRPYYLCSESEKWRARAVLQVAIAKLDGSVLVVLDGADILDAEGRNGLIDMLASDEELYFLVAMTVSSRDKLPDLATAGLGASYWMKDGNADPLAQAQAQAA